MQFQEAQRAQKAANKASGTTVAIIKDASGKSSEKSQAKLETTGAQSSGSTNSKKVSIVKEQCGGSAGSTNTANTTNKKQDLPLAAVTGTYVFVGRL